MLISEKQHAANCRNALLSTGPGTTEGKAAARLNALRHGLRARTILLPGEKSEDYDRLCADLESEWDPQTRTEQLLVEQMVVAQWKLARLEVGERSILLQDMPAERQMALLDRFSVQKARLERSFSKAMQELRELRKPRKVLAAASPAVNEPAARRPLPANHGGGTGPLPPYVMAPVPSTIAT